MDFKNGQELLKLCEQEQCSVSEIMKRRDCLHQPGTDLRGIGNDHGTDRRTDAEIPFYYERFRTGINLQSPQIHERTDRGRSQKDYGLWEKGGQPWRISDE